MWCGRQGFNRCSCVVVFLWFFCSIEIQWQENIPSKFLDVTGISTSKWTVCTVKSEEGSGKESWSFWTCSTIFEMRGKQWGHIWRHQNTQGAKKNKPLPNSEALQKRLCQLVGIDNQTANAVQGQVMLRCTWRQKNPNLTCFLMGSGCTLQEYCRDGKFMKEGTLNGPAGHFSN